MQIDARHPGSRDDVDGRYAHGLMAVFSKCKTVGRKARPAVFFILKMQR
jgi:hypothetical protein